MTPILHRVMCVALAFVCGWLVYMLGMVLTSYDGLWSLLLQPVMAALFSGVAVLLSLLIGLVFRLRPIGNWWRSTYLWAGTLFCTGTLLLVFGYPLGLKTTVRHFETGAAMEILRPEIAAPAYFAMIFALANWPRRKKSSAALLMEPDRPGET